MARFIAELPTGKPDDMVRFIAEDYLSKEGFKQKVYKGELVWKKGNGLLTAPQFIKFVTHQGHVHLEAWIKQAILPGVYVGEMGLDGGYGFAIKKLLKDRVDALARLLYQPVEGMPPIPGVAPAAPVPPSEQTVLRVDGVPVPVSPYPTDGAAPGMPPYYAVPPMQPIPLAVHNPTGQATASLICGLASAFGCVVPLAGVVCGIIGIVTGNMGRKSTAKGMATAGLVLSIIFLIASVINWIAGIYLALIGAL